MKRYVGANLIVRTVNIKTQTLFRCWSSVLLLPLNRAVAGIGLLLLLGLWVHSTPAQSPTPSPDDSVVLVKSWKRGNARVVEQVLNITLQSKTPQYVFEIDDATDPQRRYQLRLIARVEHTPRTSVLPCWSADFREVTPHKVSGGSSVGFHLLSVEGPGVGDYFPREEWAGHFCPIEKPKEMLDGHFYPIRAERRFLIEEFLLSMQVTDYQYDDKTARLKKLDLRIEFKNRENEPLSSTSANVITRVRGKRN